MYCVCVCTNVPDSCPEGLMHVFPPSNKANVLHELRQCVNTNVMVIVSFIHECECMLSQLWNYFYNSSDVCLYVRASTHDVHVAYT